MIRSAIRKHSILIFIIAVLALPLALAGQVKVTRVTAPESIASKKGVFYSLPRTVLTVTIEYTETDRLPGPYASFASELLGMEDAIKEKQVSFSVDHVSISSHSEPDPDQVFFVEMQEKAEEAALIAFTNCGLMMGSTGLTEETAHESSGFKAMGSDTLSEAALFPAYKRSSTKEVVDTIIRIVTFDTVSYQEKILQRLQVDQTEKEKAEEAVSMINTIGQDQYSLLVGYQETAYDHGAIKFMFDQLGKQRQSYLTLFSGITRHQKHSVSYTVVPVEEMIDGSYELAGFSVTKGVAGLKEGETISLEIVRTGNTALIGGVQQAAAGNGSGYYYRIPETCVVSVKLNGQVVEEEALIINQAGVVRRLPPEVNQVEFYPSTGSIKKVILK